MTPLVANVTYLIGAGTILLNVLLVVFIVVTLFDLRLREWLHERVGTHGTLVALGIVSASLVGSLFYSQVAGFSACLICWLIRAMLYPQIVLLAWYLYGPKNHRWLMTVSLIMSIFATALSLYQILLQVGAAPDIGCSLVPSLGSCETEYFRIFGYINIASMSLISSLALVVCQAVTLHRKHWLPAKAKKFAQIP